MLKRRRGQQGRREWWTRERVILGLQRFYEDRGYCPLSTEEYNAATAYTGRDPAGRQSLLPHHKRYPSFYAVLKFFKTFRSAWSAAGCDVDRAFEEWTAIEDWFVLETVGIMPRSEVAEILKRSMPAIKRRLYDLGEIRSYNRWGITLTHAEKLMGLSQQVVRKYLDHGIIPYLKGNKLYYLNPADLLKVEEMDWSKPVDPELEQLIRAAVAQRVCKMLKFGPAWRDHEVYKFNKTKERFGGRVKNPRQSAFTRELPPMPNDLKTGEWVAPSKPLTSMRHPGKRVGVIKAIKFSVQRGQQRDGTYRSCWVARVEFPKIRTITNEKDTRIKWTIPLDVLVRAEPPNPEPRPLSDHPEAVKGRQRIKAVRDEIAGQLT